MWAAPLRCRAPPALRLHRYQARIQLEPNESILALHVAVMAYSGFDVTPIGDIDAITLDEGALWLTLDTRTLFVLSGSNGGITWTPGHGPRSEEAVRKADRQLREVLHTQRVRP